VGTAPAGAQEEAQKEAADRAEEQGQGKEEQGQGQEEEEET
jgi:hypothetical protein